MAKRSTKNRYFGRYVKWLFFGVVSIVLAGAFLLGPFIAFSPIKVGYQKQESTLVTIYSKDTSQLSEFYHDIDENLKKAEDQYQLRYNKRLKMFIAFTQDEFTQFVPWMKNNRSLGGVTLLVGNVLYINKEAIQSLGYSEEELVNHEVVKNLLFQNQSLINRIKLSNIQWLSKGIATYFGGPYYYTELEFKDKFASSILEKSERPHLLYTNLDPQNSEFNYTLYRFFVQYLIDTYGKPQFNQFLFLTMKNPDNIEQYFEDTFGDTFMEVLFDFESIY